MEGKLRLPKVGFEEMGVFVAHHVIFDELGEDLVEMLPAVHSLTGCDTTSKIGTKSKALAVMKTCMQDLLLNITGMKDAYIPQCLEIYKIKNSFINGDILDDLCHLIDYGDIDGELLPIINEPVQMITLILAPVGSALGDVQTFAETPICNNFLRQFLTHIFDLILQSSSYKQ